GGECELQDLAMGYGRSVSRFTERKRVVKDKNAGALVQTDMTRCIHCTRCVRFLEEIAGTTEMGGSGRGDRLEIGTCVEKSIDSELSGNIIDLCPVGALTNKPFRFAARAWELVAKPSVGAHDAVGSLLYHHARNGRILRSVPRDNEATNEAWLSDRDRYSHTGLYAADRVMQPLVKTNGTWQEVSWDEAAKAAVRLLREAGENASQEFCALISPSAATEEHYLAQKLVRGLGSNNIDHRVREQDFSDDALRPVAPTFGMKIAAMSNTDAVLLVGCNPRHEAPILGHRLRQAWLNGASISCINPLDWEFVFGTRQSVIVAPQFLVTELAAVASAVAATSNKELPGLIASLAATARPEARHSAIANDLLSSQRGLLFVGQFAMSHHASSALRQISSWIAQTSGCELNLLSAGANPVGAWLAGAVPHRRPGGRLQPGGMNSSSMIGSSAKSWLLWGLEPEFDIANPAAAMDTLQSAGNVLAVSAFATATLKRLATVILPLAPLAESEGSLVNLDGTTIAFTPAGTVQGEARPGWKILRRLGDALGLEGFGQASLTELQAEMQAMLQTPRGEQSYTGAELPGGWQQSDTAQAGVLYRVGEVPMYSVDALCRRAAALQQTVHADSEFVGLNPLDAGRLGLSEGGTARVRQAGAFTELTVRVSDRVPAGAAWLRSATACTRELGLSTGPVQVEVA
ncbi:MAG: molybdopterin-dependent oxidoreductase, partial [Lysobacterales bacterium]